MILRTPRLVLRRIEPRDEGAIVELCADPRVMDPLGGPLTREETQAWLAKLDEHWRAHGYGRFLVEKKDGTFVGVVGLSRTDFDAGIIPAIEIAWRLAHAQWGNGYATEAARRVLDDARQRLSITHLVAVTTVGNTRSRAVMKRLGMTESTTFDHPRIPEDSPLRAHVVYRYAAYDR